MILLSFTFVAHAQTDTIVDVIGQHCPQCPAKMHHSTSAYILEYGEEALLSRAWLVENARESIDVQYFIWSTDNIGILASEALLRAAERGVKVRVLVDDLLIDADNDMLVALNSHPNVDIKIYNPKHSVGTPGWKRVLNIVTDFRGVNQRMHDKTAIFDNAVGITGGRNMADEYFDYDPQYNFRDRDIVLMGKAVNAMTVNFNEFWHHPLSQSVDDLLKGSKEALTDAERNARLQELHAYALEERNFETSVRSRIDALPDYFPQLIDAMIWGEVQFISDSPGKNSNKLLLTGGGETTTALIEKIQAARKSVVIQSPYLVVPSGGIKLFKTLIDSGVSVTIITNSLASTDNLMAYSGYHKQRKKLLEAGVQLYEYKDRPAIQQELNERYPRLREMNPLFAIHAKSMVIDEKTLYIGTFNLDPRSANLNTEVGALIDNELMAAQLQSSILKDARPENSWRITHDFNPDHVVDFPKRVKLQLMKLVPMKNLL